MVVEINVFLPNLSQDTVVSLPPCRQYRRQLWAPQIEDLK